MKKVIYILLFQLLSSSTIIEGAFSAGSSTSSESNSSSSNSSNTNNNSSYSTLLSSENSRVNEIQIAINKNELEKAYDLARSITIELPKNADAWNLLGFSSRQLNKLDESKKAYRSALKINPDHVGALEYYGELYLVLNQPKKALELLERLQDLCSFNCLEMNKLEESIKNYKNN